MDAAPRTPWLVPTVLGVGLASLFSDWSHEVATAAMPAFLASLGVAAAWIGAIEGISDGVSAVAKLGSGYYTDRLPRRKPIAVLGYLVTALGTASLGLATQAWHVLLARSGAWLGRGVRTPVRKALLTAAVPPQAYGRALGFERMMDTLGAIVGPATAFVALHSFHATYPQLFALTLVPGLLAALMIGLLVRETSRPRIKHISFGDSLRSLDPRFRRFLGAVGFFGMGDFSHTLLILYATQQLTPTYGAAQAGSFAVGLYLVHNLVNAVGALLAGWLADSFNRRKVVAGGFAAAALMALGLVVAPPSLSTLAALMALGGLYRAVEDTAQDAVAADLVDDRHHGMAFGVLATVTGVGDMLSSVLVGALWSAYGAPVAFGWAAAMMLVGALLMLRP